MKLIFGDFLFQFLVKKKLKYFSVFFLKSKMDKCEQLYIMNKFIYFKISKAFMMIQKLFKTISVQ